jgi:ribonuclease HI
VSYEPQLRKAATEFKDFLQRAGIEAELDESSFRQYHVKLTVLAAGNIIIYYSPKKDTFKPGLQEYQDAENKDRIEELWHEWNGSKPEQTVHISIPEDVYVAFVDGSFLAGSAGYGAVILYNGNEQYRLSGAVMDSSTRQVAGEITAVIKVLNWCVEQDVSEIHIFYDYEGIEKWATGDWKAKSPVSQEYVQHINDLPVTIIWYKVKSHSGVKWNDIADELAKQGALTVTESSESDEVSPMSEAEHALKRVRYYYDVLYPYRDANFDFRDFAIALEEAVKVIEGHRPNFDHLYSDFQKLEALYRELQESVS